MELVRKTKVLGRLPVVNFAAGGVATPADAALMMQVMRNLVVKASRRIETSTAGKTKQLVVYTEEAVVV